MSHSPKKRFSHDRAKTGVGKLFTRRAALEKKFKPRSARIGKAKKKVITSANVKFFTQNQVKSKKRSSPPQAVVCPVLANMMMTVHLHSRSMIGHVFTVQNAKKEDIWAFFNILEGQCVFQLKGGHVLQKENVW